MRRALGYAWAGLALPIVLGVFFGMEPLSRALAGVTGLRISPLYTGGEEAFVVLHSDYKMVVHRPVFEGLFRDSSEGFVQVDWLPTGALPGFLEESVSVLGEGRGSFRVQLDARTGTAVLVAKDPSVLGVKLVSPLNGGWAVRVSVKNPRWLCTPPAGGGARYGPWFHAGY